MNELHYTTDLQQLCMLENKAEVYSKSQGISNLGTKSAGHKNGTKVCSPWNNHQKLGAKVDFDVSSIEEYW